MREVLFPTQPNSVLNKEFSPPVETRPPDLVFYAGSNPRREDFLKFCFPDSEILTIDPGPEDKTHAVDQIMASKIDSALPRARAKMLGKPDKTGIVVAADTESFPLILDKNGKPTNLGKGKPSTIAEVRDTFQSMSEAAKKMSERWGQIVNPIYYVNASSGSRDLQTNAFRPKTHGCTIELDPEIIRALGTVSGFNRYINEFLNFFSNPKYLQNPNHPPISLTSIAGGIDVAVLSRLGAVIKVDDIQKDAIDFKQTLGYAINHAILGIHSTVLRPFNPNIDEKVKNWQWQQVVTDYAMGEV